MALILNCHICNKPITISTSPSYIGEEPVHTKCILAASSINKLLASPDTIPFDLAVGYNPSFLVVGGCYIRAWPHVWPYEFNVINVHSGEPVVKLHEALDSWHDRVLKSKTPPNGKILEVVVRKREMKAAAVFGYTDSVVELVVKAAKSWCDIKPEIVFVED